MKHNIKKALSISLVLTIVFSTSILPQVSHAQSTTKQKTTNKTISYSEFNKQNNPKKQNGRKNILVIKNKKTKINGVNYPDFIPQDNAITYPDRINDSWVTYPDIPSEDHITYPEYLYPSDAMPLIIDEEDAYDYLYDVLSSIKRFNLNKNFIEIEEFEDFPFAGDVEEWYFSYGPEKNGVLIPTKYFAVNEEGDIFEYNFKTDSWSVLAVVYKK